MEQRDNIHYVPSHCQFSFIQIKFRVDNFFPFQVNYFYHIILVPIYIFRPYHTLSVVQKEL